MRGARSRYLSGICVMCLGAVGCSPAGETTTEDQLPAVAAQAGGGAAGLANLGPGSTAGAPAGLGSGPAAGRGIMVTAGTTALGVAGSAAQASAGTARAPRMSMSAQAGQAGAATAGAPSAQAGTGVTGVTGAAGSAGTAGNASAAAGTGAAAPGGPCPLPFSNQVDDGVPVSGAGCRQQWEGIVMTKGGRGLCTAAFISDRHLISASHCYASDGTVSVDVSAPTWDNGGSHMFQATVKRSGSNMSLDVSIIDLGKPVEWATPERRFVLHAGKVPASVEMHTYGFGSGGGSGAAGVLRGIPDRATITVTDDGRGNLNGKAGEARLCSGDSGGPAFVEKTAAILYGINQAIVPTGVGGRGLGGTCAGPDWTIMFTNVSEYMDFVEMALGKMCERKKVDDLDVAQCW